MCAQLKGYLARTTLGQHNIHSQSYQWIGTVDLYFSYYAIYYSLQGWRSVEH